MIRYIIIVLVLILLAGCSTLKAELCPNEQGWDCFFKIWDDSYSFADIK